MADDAPVMVHFKDVDIDERVRESIESRCDALAHEFPEVSRFEVTVTGDGVGYSVHGHATGKNTDIATHAGASDPGPATELVLDKIQKQLRKVHDKRIFGQRREAQRDPPKRKGGA